MQLFHVCLRQDGLNMTPLSAIIYSFVIDLWKASPFSFNCSFSWSCQKAPPTISISAARLESSDLMRYKNLLDSWHQDHIAGVLVSVCFSDWQRISLVVLSPSPTSTPTFLPTNTSLMSSIPPGSWTGSYFLPCILSFPFLFCQGSVW